MSIIIPDVGKTALLNKMLKLSVDENLVLKLYRNNYTPDSDTVLGDLTEANFTNYAAKTLVKASWTAAAIVTPIAPCVENEAQSTYAEQSWTCGSVGNTIYGYYVVGATSTTTVLFCEKFASSRSLSENDVLKITPQFNFRTQIACS